jgi:hypothetical protein
MPLPAPPYKACSDFGLDDNDESTGLHEKDIDPANTPRSDIAAVERIPLNGSSSRACMAFRPSPIRAADVVERGGCSNLKMALIEVFVQPPM